MKVDFTLIGQPGDWDQAVSAEQRGYDCAWFPETSHDPFPVLAIAANRTESIQLGTAIAVTFARNPMSMAVTANDLQLYSRGRFLLGVGSQVKAHITKRFSMPWSSPAQRMREFILAMRAIWQSWNTAEPLRFEGEFYRHTLMTPFFNPGPNPFGAPPVILAGVGPQMTKVAGEVADGFFLHGFTTPRYLREVTLPALRAGRAAAGKDGLDGFEMCGMPFIVTAEDEKQMQSADALTRKQIAFYASTPAYRPVLDLHGWGDLSDELNRLSKLGEWDAMGRLITDEMVHEIAIVAPPDKVAGRLLEMYGDLFTRTGFYAPYPVPDGFWDPIKAALQSA
ncbi:MAG TPA: TIGR03617 family F420-dependent LLM class oxidoreductase [Mycobacterium sp.]|nr:TIGR03617 family F420-dependent LLM class oxidoreductase [Mycobacterium sp.]